MQSDSVSIVLLLPQTINAKDRASVMEMMRRMSMSETELNYACQRRLDTIVRGAGTEVRGG
jgi:hypothetical protein